MKGEFNTHNSDLISIYYLPEIPLPKIILEEKFMKQYQKKKPQVWLTKPIILKERRSLL